MASLKKNSLYVQILIELNFSESGIFVSFYFMFLNVFVDTIILQGSNSIQFVDLF
jgi:hypothetical protein